MIGYKFHAQARRMSMNVVKNLVLALSRNMHGDADVRRIVARAPATGAIVTPMYLVDFHFSWGVPAWIGGVLERGLGRDLDDSVAGFAVVFLAVLAAVTFCTRGVVSQKKPTPVEYLTFVVWAAATFFAAPVCSIFFETYALWIAIASMGFTVSYALIATRMWPEKSNEEV